jgi:hypothetical protein
MRHPAAAMRLRLLLSLLLLAAQAGSAGRTTALAADLTFQSDNWTAECAIGDQLRTIVGDCSVTGVFQDSHVGSAAGSFALLVGLQPAAVAIVGRPFPLHAELRIDAYPPFNCTGARYCVFPVGDTSEILDELGRGSLILVDIETAKNAYRASLSAVGYRVSLAKIRAEQQ